MLAFYPFERAEQAATAERRHMPLAKAAAALASKRVCEVRIK